MNNVPSSVILTVAGIIAAMVVIGFGYMFLSTQQTTGQEGNKKVAEVNTAINDNKYDQYDAKLLRGSDVLAAIEYFSNDDISVAVNNGTKTSQYIRNYNSTTEKYEPFTGEATTVPKTEDEAKRIAQAKNKSSNAYINPSDLYSGKVIRSSSTNEIMQIEFSLDSGSSYQRPQESTDAGSDTPVSSDKYTITYDPNGGTGTAYNYIADKGSTVTILSNNATQFSKANYTFIGWSKDPNATIGDPAFAAGMNYSQNTTAALKLYAIYSKITYTISYKSNGGKFADRDGSVTKDGLLYTISDGGTTISQVVGQGDTSAKIYPDKPTKTGYNFLGYATSPSSTNVVYQPGDYIDTTQPVSLYAVWSNQVVKIHYDANGGKQDASNPMQDQNIQIANPSYLNSNTFTKDNATFAGWSTVPNGNVRNELMNSITFTGNEDYLTKENVNGNWTGNYTVTLYAVWTRAAKYTVTFDLNKVGATWAPGTTKQEDKDFPLTKLQNNQYANQDVNGIFTFNSVEPQCEYYSFAGWNTRADGKGNTFYAGGQTSISASTTFYAQWKETQSSYRIESYLQNPDGTWPQSANGAILENSIYGTNINVSIDTPTGYEFDADTTGVNSNEISKLNDNEKFFTVKIGSQKHYSTVTNNGKNTYVIKMYYKTVEKQITFFAQEGVKIKNIKVNGNTPDSTKGPSTVAGNTSGVVKVPYGSSISFEAEVDTANGYVFHGWTNAENDKYMMSLVRPYQKDKNKTDDKDEDPITIYDDTSITAMATKTNMKITYIMNGGSHAGSTTEQAAFDTNLKSMLGSKYDLYKGLYSKENGLDPNEYYATDTWLIHRPYRIGYTFLGWKSSYPIQNWSPTKSSDGKILSFTIPTNTKSPLSFEALWGISGTENDTWNLTYNYQSDVQGDTSFDKSKVVSTGNPSKYTTEDSFTLQAPTMPGYTFVGWTASVQKYNGETVDTNGLVKTASIQGKAIFNNAASATTAFTETAKGNPLKVSAGSYGPIVFTAHFTKRSDCIVYFSASGSDKPDSVTPKSVSGAYKANISALIKTATKNAQTMPTAERTGYTVEGWYTDANVKLDANSTMPSEPTTYRAKWKPNTYTIKFNANGGSGTMADKKMTYDTPANLTKNTFTRTGYTFLGWSTAPTQDVAYSDGEYVSNLTVNNGGTVTLYAMWSNNAYNVTYNMNGGTPNGEMPNVAYVDKSFTVKDPSKTGYIFTSWTQDGKSVGTHADGKTTFKNLANKVGDTVTLTANWTTTGTKTKVAVQFMLENLNEHTGETTANYALVDTQYFNIDTNTALSVKAGTGSTTSVAGGTITARTYTGYTYSKATFAPNNETKVRADGTTVVTLFYKRNKYTLTFAPETESAKGFTSVSFTTSYNHNGTWDSANKNAVQNVYYGETVTLNSTVQSGFTLGGYKQDTTTLTGNTFVMPAANTKAYAFVKSTTGDEYKITYTNMEGASNDYSNPTTVRDTNGNVSTTIGPMYKRGYHVSSFELTSGKAKATSGTITEIGKTNTVKSKLNLSNIESDLSIMVHWEPNEYSIQYVDDSGKNATKTVSGYTYGKNDNLAGSDTFKRNGYELVGWAIVNDTTKNVVQGNAYEDTTTYSEAKGYYKVGQTTHIDKLPENFDTLAKKTKGNFVEDWKYNNTAAASITGYTDSASNTVTLHAVWKQLPVKVTIQDLFVSSDYLTYLANMSDPAKTHASAGYVKNSETYAFYPGEKISAESVAGQLDKGYGGDGINNASRTVTTIDEAKKKMGTGYVYLGSDTKIVQENGDTILYRYYQANAKVQVTLPNNKYGLQSASAVSANDVSIDTEFAVNAANEKTGTNVTSFEAPVFSGQYITVKNIQAKNASYLYDEQYGASVTYGMVADPVTAGFAQGKLTGTSASGYSVRVDDGPTIISVNFTWNRYIIRYHVNGGTTTNTKQFTGMSSIVQHRKQQSDPDDVMMYSTVSGSDLSYDMYVTRGREDQFTIAKPNANTTVYNQTDNGLALKQVTALGFTKSGYVFAGWNTHADGTGVNYKVGDKVSADTRQDTFKVFDLYAQWTKDGEGGGVTINDDDTITNNSTWAAYVIMKVSVPVDASGNQLVTYTLGNNWKEVGRTAEAAEDRTVVIYYGYNNVIQGGQSTPKWKTAETVNNDVLNKTSETYASVGTMAYAVSAKSGMDISKAYNEVKRG